MSMVLLNQRHLGMISMNQDEPCDDSSRNLVLEYPYEHDECLMHLKKKRMKIMIRKLSK